jgi:hypothetical protein
MNSKRKKTKKTTGTSRRSFLVFCLSAFSIQAEPSYAVIAGAVFRESGHAFPGVEIELLPGKPDKKNKRQTLRSSPRGEFAFRVPAAEMEYNLSVKVEGYRPESKRVKIVGDERVEQNFLLERVRKEN